MTEDEMVGWYHRFNGHESGHTPGESERQETWHALWSQRVGRDLVTEQEEITIILKFLLIILKCTAQRY